MPGGECRVAAFANTHFGRQGAEKGRHGWSEHWHRTGSIVPPAVANELNLHRVSLFLCEHHGLANWGVCSSLGQSRQPDFGPYFGERKLRRARPSVVKVRAVPKSWPVR